MDIEKPDFEPDIEPDSKPNFAAGSLRDKAESISQMEPLILGSECSARAELLDLCLDVVSRSASLSSRIPDGILGNLAALVRSMNCYYSNLIEGHDTHPFEIEKALRGDYSSDKTKRNLQLEAKAHISVQEWMEAGSTAGRNFAEQTILEVHKRFCEQLPDELLWVEGDESRERLIPGELRKGFVRVGAHIAISPGAVPRFLQRYEQAYQRLGRTEAILSLAAAHHRLLWILPFPDGNGRVARLLTNSCLQELLTTGGVWSVARGLARNVDDYKRYLHECDGQRRNDYDGRGNLSEEALVRFTRFFLETCLDQIDFMERLIHPDHLRARILSWVQLESQSDGLMSNAGRILESILYRGELPRGEVPALLGVGDRQARRVVNALMVRGALTSDSDRAPLQMRFPAALASAWMPGLFPERPG